MYPHHPFISVWVQQRVDFLKTQPGGLVSIFNPHVKRFPGNSFFFNERENCGINECYSGDLPLQESVFKHAPCCLKMSKQSKQFEPGSLCSGAAFYQTDCQFYLIKSACFTNTCTVRPSSTSSHKKRRGSLGWGWLGESKFTEHHCPCEIELLIW